MKSVSRKVLITWELGADLGHIARLRPVARELSRRGHEVVFAASDLHNATHLPGSLRIIPAPAKKADLVKYPIRQPATFADILYNAGAAQPGILDSLVRGWQGIFNNFRPDVVVQDFSPFTLLSLAGQPAASVLLGTGFACPPPLPRLPDIRAWQNHYPDRIRATEDEVLQALNVQLDKQDQPSLGAIGELFTRVDANLLATFPDLDHYPQRRDAGDADYEYCGTWSDLGGAAPRWPDVPGKRVFAYLKKFRGLPGVLDHLKQSGHPTIVFLPGDMDTRRWQSDTMTIVREPLHMGEVSASCDLALLHAGHGSTATMLLAGKPIVQIPFVIEQYHTAQNTGRLGAGIHAAANDMNGICQAFDQVVANKEFTAGAAEFARKHADHDPDKALHNVVSRIEDCAAS